MTFTSRIHEELFEPSAVSTGTDQTTTTRMLIRMPLTHPRGAALGPGKRRERRGRQRRVSANPKNPDLAWSADEHERFLRGLELFPRGPWKDVAQLVGTRTVRQTMTHAQKYRQKIARHKRVLQSEATNVPAVGSAPQSVSTVVEHEDSAAATLPMPEVTGIHTSVNVASFTPSPAGMSATTDFDSRSISLPPSMEQLGFGGQTFTEEDAVWQTDASAATVSSTTPLLSLPSYHILEPIDVVTVGNVPVPAGWDSNELDLLLDNEDELDSLVADNMVFNVVMPYFGACPTNVSVDGSVDASSSSWGFADLP